jgi:hypothetical protein
VTGTVSGLLAGTQMVLQDNGGDRLTVTANGAFAFATALASGAAYAVTVSIPPTGESCMVQSGSGSVASANVSVSVVCASGTTLPAIDLKALAIIYTSLQAASQMADLEAVAEAITPCATGTATYDSANLVESYANCSTAYEGGNVYSGQLAASDANVPNGLLDSLTGTLTLVNQNLGTTLQATLALPVTTVGTFQSTAALTGSTLSAKFSTPAMTITTASNAYALTNYILYASRTLSAGVVTTTLPFSLLGGSVGFNADGNSYSIASASSISWTGANYPSSGALTITVLSGNGLALATPTFTFDGAQMTVLDLTNGINLPVTVQWTDAAVHAALLAATN